jgi:predicted molibdopterin-dependent oxidoreductase YjgC
MDKQDEEERLLMEEILTVIEENENCFACHEGNGDCVIQEIEMHLLDTGSIAFNESSTTTKKEADYSPMI